MQLRHFHKLINDQFLLFTQILFWLMCNKIRPKYSFVYLSFIYLTFYVYFYFFMLLSNDRTTSCSKSWDRYHIGSAGISVDFYVYVPINIYRCVEEQFFCIFIMVLRIHLLKITPLNPIFMGHRFNPILTSLLRHSNGFDQSNRVLRFTLIEAMTHKNGI